MKELSTPKAAYWHALNLISHSNSLKFLKPAEVLGGPESLFYLNENQLLKAGLDPSIAALIIAKRKEIDPVVEWEKLNKSKIKAVCISDKEYPKRLTQIPYSPPLIYVRGKVDMLDLGGIAVVGSRKISSYGKNAIEQIVPSLVDVGFSIISGMAIGVDATALGCCIKRGGVPIAVLASGLADNEISPQTNFRLAEQIMEIGCLVSENAPGTSIYRAHFPMRNRIVSGLSMGVLIVEASLKSGSLITAKHALEQNREVFAIPGSIFTSASSGTLDLIKRGAKCVTHASDIVQEFGWDVKLTKVAVQKLPSSHQKIYQLICRSTFNAEELLKQSQIASHELMPILTELELDGFVKKTSDGNYVRIK